MQVLLCLQLFGISRISHSHQVVFFLHMFVSFKLYELVFDFKVILEAI